MLLSTSREPTSFIPFNYNRRLDGLVRDEFECMFTCFEACVFVVLTLLLQDLNKPEKLSQLQGLMAEVKLRPTTSQKEKTAVQNTVDAQKFIVDLQTQDEALQKKVCFELRNRMKEEAFAKEFKLQNGTSLLSKMIQKTKGK